MTNQWIQAAIACTRSRAINRPTEAPIRVTRCASSVPRHLAWIEYRRAPESTVVEFPRKANDAAIKKAKEANDRHWSKYIRQSILLFERAEIILRRFPQYQMEIVTFLREPADYVETRKVR